MMYLLTMGWSLAHTSLAITPEQSVTNGEYSSLRSARRGHEARSLVSAKYGVVRLSRRLSRSLDDVQMTGGLLSETLLSYQRNE